MKTVQKWKKALNKVSNFIGHHYKGEYVLMTTLTFMIFNCLVSPPNLVFFFFFEAEI